jgi:hypothetical protein
MADLPFPLTGTTLLTGPSNTGKTRLTARALTVWVAEHGTDGVVALDFAPELRQNDRLLGGFLTRFTDIPDDVWYGRVDADAPRAAGATEAESLELAAANARQSKQLVETAPADPHAVFINDATIPFQASVFDPTVLFAYCDTAAGVILNAFESDELGVDDAISRNERTTLSALRSWADCVVER